MEFPVLIPVGPWLLHPHPVFETLAFVLGYRLYLRQRRIAGDILSDRDRLELLVAAAGGALMGSRLLALLEDPTQALGRIQELSFLFGGKSVVGGLLGGLVAVELTKAWRGMRTATGDLYALPLCLAIAVGRIGCFLAGLPDGTHGTPTALPWGVDFGDGLPRHPTQLYEIGVVALLAATIVGRRASLRTPGDQFKLFMVGYLAWRLGVEFIKPDHRLVLGLSAIQVACALGLLYYARHVPRLLGLGARKPAWQTG